MDDYKTMLREGERSLRQAQQMIEFTYPLVQEQRLLLPIVEHICSVFRFSLLAVLHYEKLQKKTGDSFSLQYHVFRTSCAEKYQVLSLLPVFDEAREVLSQHKVSDVEFVRDGSLLLFSEGFSHMKSLDLLSVRKYFSAAREFFSLIRQQLGGVVVHD